MTATNAPQPSQGLGPFELAICDALLGEIQAAHRQFPAAAEYCLEIALENMREGAPAPPFASLTDEAIDWCSLASVAEVAVYAWCCANRMPANRRRAFIRKLEEGLDGL